VTPPDVAKQVTIDEILRAAAVEFDVAFDVVVHTPGVRANGRSSLARGAACVVAGELGYTNSDIADGIGWADQSSVPHAIEVFRTKAGEAAESRIQIVREMAISFARDRLLGHDPLSFFELRAANVARCAEFGHGVEDWSPADWATAVAGELGEAFNLLKKRRRGEPINNSDIAHELADTVIYLDLLASRLGIDLGAAIRQKFNIVSERRGLSVRLPEGETS